LVNEGKSAAEFSLEIDPSGKGEWTQLRSVSVLPGDAAWMEFGDEAQGEWVRVKAGADCEKATVHFAFSGADTRSAEPDPIFAGLAKIGDAAATGGFVRCRGENKRTLALAAHLIHGASVNDVGAFALDAALRLEPLTEADALANLDAKLAIPRNVVSIDSASALVVDDRGRRWRFPKTTVAYDEPTRDGQLRLSREVSTERDLFSLCGTFYELPAENADGFAKIRPVASHDYRVNDYCSYRGLMILTGIEPNAATNEHIIRSTGGAAALWVGAIDDLWKLGRPRGSGGPWRETAVKAGVPSDPFLFWGFPNRRLELENRSGAPVTFRIEADLTGEGLWVPYRSIELGPKDWLTHIFSPIFQARWLRFVADRDCTASATLTYN
jgi:hypothetical protein